MIDGPRTRREPASSDELTRALRRRWVPLAVAALTATGAGLRLLLYARNRSFWNDEALLALNIADRSYGELLQRLDFNQAAPPGFLLIERFALQAFGDGEYALRLVPLLCGIASLPLFWKLASKVLAPTAALCALALFAIADPLLYYASELKQYGSDVAAVIVVLLGAVLFRERAASRRDTVVLAAAGLVVAAGSHAATITLAGVMAATLAEALWKRRRPHVRVLAAVGAFWLACAAVYAGVAISATRGIREGWRLLPDAFAPLPPGSLGDLKWYAANVHGFLEGLGASSLWAVLAAALIAAGVASLFRRDGWTIAILLAPLALTLLASGLELYPLLFRFQIFIIPTALILIGEGLTLARRYAGVPAFVVLLVLVAAAPARATLDTLRDSGREETRPLIKHLARYARDGDTLYVYYGAQAAVSYYAECRDCGTRAVAGAFGIRRARAGGAASPLVSRPPTLVVGSPRWRGYARQVQEVRRLDGTERAWFLFSHYVTPDGVDERGRFVATLERLGEVVSVRETQGAVLYLYDLDR